MARSVGVLFLLDTLGFIYVAKYRAHVPERGRGRFMAAPLGLERAAVLSVDVDNTRDFLAQPPHG